MRELVVLKEGTAPSPRFLYLQCLMMVRYWWIHCVIMIFLGKLTVRKVSWIMCICNYDKTVRHDRVPSSVKWPMLPSCLEMIHNNFPLPSPCNYKCMVSAADAMLILNFTHGVGWGLWKVPQQIQAVELLTVSKIMWTTSNLPLCPGQIVTVRWSIRRIGLGSWLAGALITGQSYFSSQVSTAEIKMSLWQWKGFKEGLTPKVNRQDHEEVSTRCELKIVY